MTTLAKAKQLIHSKTTQTVETGPKNFQKLREWTKSDDYGTFLTKEGIVSTSSCKSNIEEIIFVVGEAVITVKLKK